MRSAVLFIYFLISLLFSACTVNIDLSGKPGGREPPAASGLPDATRPDKVNPFGKNHQALTDGEPRLHVEYAHVENGQVKYDWDGADGAFQPNPLRPRYHPGQKVPVSVPGGTQVEHLLSIFQVPTGDWWLAYQHELLGYFPAGRFTMLNSGACVVAKYGEIARVKPASGKRPPKAEMGSGRFAEAGAGHAASVRSPRYFDLLWFTRVPPNDAMAPSEPSCYTRSNLNNDIFFLGGHGDADRGCTWPSP
jgi:Neprosin